MGIELVCFEPNGASVFPSSSRGLALELSYPKWAPSLCVSLAGEAWVAEPLWQVRGGLSPTNAYPEGARTSGRDLVSYCEHFLLEI